jgi:hypothetical protein
MEFSIIPAESKSSICEPSIFSPWTSLVEGDFSWCCDGWELVFLDSLCPVEDCKDLPTLFSSVCLELLYCLLDVVEVLVSV